MHFSLNILIIIICCSTAYDNCRCCFPSIQVVSGSVMAGSVGGVEMEEAVVSGGDLVIGCGAVSSPPHFMQSSSNDAEIMTSLSGDCLAFC